MAGGDQNDAVDVVVLAVPGDVNSLKDAIEEGRARCQEAGEATQDER